MCVYIFVVIPSPPTISLDQTEIKKLPGEDVTVTVKISGTPKPEVEWSANGTVIRKTKRIYPETQDSFATLTIKQLIESDDAEYTIKLRNAYGDAEASLRLIIISEF